MKQLEVQIMGQSYLLGCPEGGESRFQAAVQRVDQAMCRIRDAGKVKARDRIAVLAALNLAFDLNESEIHSDQKIPAPGAAKAATAPSGIDHDRLSGLIAKLDAALGDDGRLI